MKKKVSVQSLYRYLTQERYEYTEQNGEIIVHFDKPINYRLYFGRLTLEYICDQGIKIDNNNLNFHDSLEQQQKYRTSTYKGFSELVEKDGNVEDIGRKSFLPSSFKHGARGFAERYRDAMSVVGRYGKIFYFFC